jgi:hypothetical protein
MCLPTPPLTTAVDTHCLGGRQGLVPWYLNCQGTVAPVPRYRVLSRYMLAYPSPDLRLLLRLAFAGDSLRPDWGRAQKAFCDTLSTCQGHAAKYILFSLYILQCGHAAC